MKAKFDNIRILSICSCVPCDSIDLISLGTDYESTELQKIINTTGISKVRIASDSTTTSDLCYLAAENLISKNSIDKNSIDGLIFVSQTGDHKMPQTSHILQNKLGLKTDTYCIDMPIGCSGYVYGIFQACLLIQSKACKRVLLLAGDTTSKIINKYDKSLRMVFGDGASATLIEEGDDKLGCILYSDGKNHEQLIIPNGGFRNPKLVSDDDLISDKDGNKRTSNDLYMDGMGIFNFAISKVPPLIDEILDFDQISKENIDVYILHQANKFMVDYLRKKIKIPIEKMPVMVDGFGNTGPNSIPLVLSQLYYNNNSLKHTLLCGFGVGLSWGVISCDLSKTNILKTIEFKDGK
jgi:3-oxoacyl-[acyl-carrier-protein] synthase III